MITSKPFNQSGADQLLMAFLYVLAIIQVLSGRFARWFWAVLPTAQRATAKFLYQLADSLNDDLDSRLPLLLLHGPAGLHQGQEESAASDDWEIPLPGTLTRWEPVGGLQPLSQSPPQPGTGSPEPELDYQRPVDASQDRQMVSRTQIARALREAKGFG